MTLRLVKVGLKQDNIDFKKNKITSIKFLKHALPKIKGGKENCKWKEI